MMLGPVSVEPGLLMALMGASSSGKVTQACGEHKPRFGADNAFCLAQTSPSTITPSARLSAKLVATFAWGSSPSTQLSAAKPALSNRAASMNLSQLYGSVSSSWHCSKCYPATCARRCLHTRRTSPTSLSSTQLQMPLLGRGRRRPGCQRAQAINNRRGASSKA